MSHRNSVFTRERERETEEGKRERVAVFFLAFDTLSRQFKPLNNQHAQMIIINICMKHAIMHFSYKLNLKVRFYNSIHMAILSVICTKDCFSLPQSM